MRTEKVAKTGDCYEAAGRAVSQDGDSAALMLGDSAVLVHGIAVGQGQIEGRLFGHAWVEYLQDFGEHKVWFVYDNANGRDLSMPRDLYYVLGQIHDKHQLRYSKEEAHKEMLCSGHFGPWEDELSPEDEWLGA
jgi:hypothetical protein